MFASLRPLRRTPRAVQLPFFRSLIAVSTLLLVSGLPLSAQDASTNHGADEPRATAYEEIVVSASLTELPRHRTGNTVTILDRDDIERRNKVTVLELLRTVPGLEVVQGGGPGKVTSVFIRGGNSSHTLVLVDGVRVNDNATGGFDFSDLTADNLERIEVLRGPQGVLYGSEAVTGVVSIVTRRGQGPAQGWVRGSLGSDAFQRFAAGVSGGDGTVDYSVSASQVETDGVSAASEEAGNLEDDPWENLTLTSRVGADVWQDGRMDLALRYTEGETAVDGFAFGVGPVDDLNALQDRTQFSGSLTLRKPVTEVWTQKLVVSHSRDELVGEDPDNFFSNFEILGRTSSVMTQGDLSWNDRFTLSLGYRFEDREAENVGSFDESVELNSFFGEGLWSLGDAVDLSVGLRHDDHSTFGSETTYRVALSAELGQRARLHASAGSGFKAPSFNDLFFPGFGNPNLRPETSEGFDIGIELRSGDDRFVADLTYFDTEFDDLILFTFPGGIVNVAEATSSGVELTLGWRASDRVSFNVSHTFNETEDVASGRQLARRPEHRSTLDLAFDLTERLRGSATVIAVQDRIDSNGAEMDDYERVDLSLAYQLTERWRPFVRVENLLDADFVELPGFTTPGVTWAAGVQVDF